jgi:hypothetical protein
MDERSGTQELFGQIAGKTLSTMTVWADANQRLLRELVEFSSGTAQEGVRLYAELQRNTLDAVRDSQGTAARWQHTWKDAVIEPALWYQKAVTESMTAAQRTFRLLEESGQAVTRSAERLQTSAEQAGKSVQETFTGAAARMKEIYTSA